jgi:predicted flap endonuclease-1-like 5' DNA nuclease
VPRRRILRIVLTLLIIVLVALAAVGGYYLGTRQRPPRASDAAAPVSSVADSGAAPEQLEALAHDRERLSTELADARTETARYRQLLVDIENKAPPPILSGPGEPDDLKLIVGVGPVLERMLHNLGIATFRQIARWTERDVAEFDAKLPEFPGRIVRDQWVTQARALHQSKYGERP